MAARFLNRNGAGCGKTFWNRVIPNPSASLKVNSARNLAPKTKKKMIKTDSASSEAPRNDRAGESFRSLLDRLRRSRSGIFVLFLAGLVLFLPACSRTVTSETDTAQNQTASTAPVVKVVRRDLSNDLQIASEFIPYQEIAVHAKVSGYVEKLLINWGTHVKEGQLMAVLDVPELQAQVSRDQAAVQRSEQNVAGAREELLRGQSAYTVAHLTYQRFAGVQKTEPGLVSQEEVDLANGKNQEGAAAVSAAKDALAAAQQELAVNKDMLRRDRDLFGYSKITAPFEGVVTQLDAYTGSLLPAGTSTSHNALPLCRLSQNDLLRLVIPVPEQIVQDVRAGEVVNVRVPSLGRDFEGKVARFSGQINLNTRTMHTEIDVPNPHYKLIPGMYAYVQLPVKGAENALTVPIQAVEISGKGQGTVLVINGQHQIQPRQVQLGIETASEVQIASGVHEGELVVFGELSRFHSGEKVKPELVNLASVGGAG